MSWRATTASARGSEHARLFKNNQDAVAGCAFGGALAIAVADGCSQGAFSEVGARLVARFVAQKACEGASPAAVGDAVLAWLYTLANGSGAELSAFVQEQLLTTLLCAVVRGDLVTVFGVGDGVFSVDGRVTVLEAGPQNAPPYVAYRMLPEVGVDAQVRVHFSGRASRVVIGTDGAAPLMGSLNEAFGWTNPQSLQRLLNVTKGLHDDATVALLERVEMSSLSPLGERAGVRGNVDGANAEDGSSTPTRGAVVRGA